MPMASQVPTSFISHCDPRASTMAWSPATDSAWRRTVMSRSSAASPYDTTVPSLRMRQRPSGWVSIGQMLVRTDPPTPASLVTDAISRWSRTSSCR